MSRFFYCLVMSMALAAAGWAQTPSPGRWFARAPLPTARQEMPLAFLDGKIYVPGGFVRGGAGTLLIEVFEPAANRWSSFPNLPVALNHLTLVAVLGKLYVVGGYAESGFSSQGRVYEFDPQTNNWTRKRDLPTPRGALVALAFENKIYAIGGANGANAFAVNEVYDPATDSWAALRPMPTAREHLAAAVIDSLLYVVGGRFQNNFGQLVNSNQLEAYAPASNRWHRLPAMPTARGGLAAAAMNGKLYVFGGEFFGTGGAGVFEENEEYDPGTRTWREVQPLPTPRHGMSAVAVNDTIFVIGGGPVAGYGVTAANEAFTFAVPTKVEESPQNVGGFVLRQNHPNPFNAATRIAFALPAAAEVKLSVYDLHGREVAVLVQKALLAGEHAVAFDATGLASGLYHYTLRAGAFTETKKLLLLR